MSESDGQRTWGVLAVPDGLSGRGDIAAQQLRAALDAGWEPFAVARGYIWLRKYGSVGEASANEGNPMTDQQNKTTTPSISDLKRMMRRLTLKLERLDGRSLATEDARRLFDFDTAPRSQVEIEEAAEDLGM